MSEEARNDQSGAPPAPGSEFEKLAAQEHHVGLVAEFWDFLKHNKKWWLSPILLVLLLFGLLILVAGTGAAPFIYSLF